ncbi:uncharacterized protein [Amphiura filiformis]|uniref:uncharacterized protein n=1 Tax=Amphiura filiformis TaxID=82378 RepID=UPI003B2236BB
MASIDWTKKLPAVALLICGVLFCNGQAQVSAENTGALKEITDFDDDTQYPELDIDWIEKKDAAFLNPLVSPDLSWENVPLQYIKRRRNQVFSAGLFGKRSGWNQGHQNGLFGKRSDWLEEYMSGGEDSDADNADSSSQYSKKQWNPNQQTGGLFGKRNDQLTRRTYNEMLQDLHDRVESAMDKRNAAAATLGRVRTKSSGQHVFRTGGLFGKRSAEDAGMQRALWPEEEQRRK